ncbi:MAG: hypothetical protein ABSA40_04475 [Candidatus Dormibacteria bacterium]|jgi:predicted small integral membrane protein
MNRRRLYAAVFFSVVLIAVLGLLVVTEIESGTQTVTVLRLRTAVDEGAVFSASDVEAVPLRLGAGDLNYEAPGTVPANSRFALSLQPGDLLRPDDLEPGTAGVEITLTVSQPPPLQPGDAVDLFASSGSSQVLIGHALPVEQVSGDTLTVLVSSQDELAWVEIAASNTQLHAVRASALAPLGTPAPDVEAAICQLAGEQCASAAAPLTTPATPTPSASPSPSPSR